MMSFVQNSDEWTEDVIEVTTKAAANATQRNASIVCRDRELWDRVDPCKVPDSVLCTLRTRVQPLPRAG